MIEAFEKRPQLMEACAQRIADQLAAGCAARGRGAFAAAGGTTPSPAFERLARMDLPWSQITVTATDERLIAPDAPLSNYRLIKDDLLTGRAGAARQLQLWSGEGEYQDAARKADKAVSKLLPLDVTLVGMGEDGHIASLIPGSSALSVGLALTGAPSVVFVPEGEPAPVLPRLSLTMTALTNSRLVVVLVTGAAKRAVLEGASADPNLPIHHLLKQDRAPVQVLWAE